VVASAFSTWDWGLDGNFFPWGIPEEVFGTVTTLNTGFRHSGPLAISRQSRLLVTGVVYVKNNADAGTYPYYCRLQLRPDGGPPTVVSFETHDDLGPKVAHTVAMTGGMDVEEGSYDVALQCGTLGTLDGQVYFANVTASAFAL
jgi:hypothetical protein